MNRQPCLLLWLCLCSGSGVGGFGSPRFASFQHSVCDQLQSLHSLRDAREAAIEYWRQQLTKGDTDAVQECGTRWQARINRTLQTVPLNVALRQVRASYTKSRVLLAPVALTNCWQGHHSSWLDCCSQRHGPTGDTRCFTGSTRSYTSCCAIGQGSNNYRVLPALQEPKLHLQLQPGGTIYPIQQDGFLRPFNVATVLWPAGYLLALWCSSHCSQIEKQKVLELGAGVGLPSLAAAMCGGNVTATDVSPHGLALTAANSALSNKQINLMHLDWWKDQDVQSVFAASQGGFRLILGASLKFESWQRRMWKVLDNLCTADCTVVLVHTTAALDVDANWEVDAQVASSSFGMRNEYSNSSDFEISVLRKRMLHNTL